MQLIYGTKNQAKLNLMRQYLQPLPLEIVGLSECGISVPTVDERGKDPLENAELKARAYFEVLERPVFACDSGLFFDEVHPEKQPGTHVRRVGGRELTDDQMIDYYAALAYSRGGRLTAQYRNAICLVVDENHVYRSMAPVLSGGRFWLVNIPHERRIPGFPLDTLSVNIENNAYCLDLPQNDLDLPMAAGFCDFFKQSLWNLR